MLFDEVADGPGVVAGSMGAYLSPIAQSAVERVVEHEQAIARAVLAGLSISQATARVEELCAGTVEWVDVPGLLMAEARLVEHPPLSGDSMGIVPGLLMSAAAPRPPRGMPKPPTGRKRNHVHAWATARDAVARRGKPWRCTSCTARSADGVTAL